MNQKLADKITIESLEKALAIKNYPSLKIGVYYLNIIGVRSGDGFTNTFNDIIALPYRDEADKWVLPKYAITTDPGKFYMQNPASPKGTGILVPGYYPNSHRVGMHKGEYKALVQNAPLRVYRDNDKDLTFDLSPVNIEAGMFGINIHRASPSHASTIVENWSAACQVFSDPVDFMTLMNVYVVNHAAIYGDIFNYCLLEEKDLI